MKANFATTNTKIMEIRVIAGIFRLFQTTAATVRAGIGLLARRLTGAVLARRHTDLAHHQSKTGLLFALKGLSVCFKAKSIARAMLFA